jgi:hypothetical protein
MSSPEIPNEAPQGKPQEPCLLCQWVRNTIVAKELKNWRLPDGSKLEPTSFARLEPPQGVQFKKTGRWAPLCALCCQFLSAWMQTQEQVYLQTHRPATARIIMPTPDQVRSVGRIILPGQK